ncbi:MAG: hypothetical protein JOY92_07195 [Verrucomicrobia bacterium]|nr:hypothetical protein [Verrucomicrobiota bacterium]
MSNPNSKITFIGAGSTVFAKNLIGDILSFPELADFINPRKGDAGLAKAIESKFPVLVFGPSGHPQEHAVGTKDGEASCQATEHLLALGHERIAYVSYAPLVYLPARKRFEG